MTRFSRYPASQTPTTKCRLTQLTNTCSPSATLQLLPLLLQVAALAAHANSVSSMTQALKLRARSGAARGPTSAQLTPPSSTRHFLRAGLGARPVGAPRFEFDNLQRAKGAESDADAE